MKKLLLILLCLPLLFNACKKEEGENNPDSPFVGYWSGTYSGDDASGFWNGTISSNGEINGGASSVDLPDEGFDLNGTVTNSGDFTAIMGTGLLGINFIGQLSGNSGSGTWSSSADSSIGTWEGHNYNQ